MLALTSSLSITLSLLYNFSKFYRTGASSRAVHHWLSSALSRGVSHRMVADCGPSAWGTVLGLRSRALPVVDQQVMDPLALVLLGARI